MWTTLRIAGLSVSHRARTASLRKCDSEVSAEMGAGFLPSMSHWTLQKEHSRHEALQGGGGTDSTDSGHRPCLSAGGRLDHGTSSSAALLRLLDGFCGEDGK